LPEPAEAATNTDEIAAAIGVDASAIGFDGHRPHCVRAGNNWLFVPLADRAAVEGCLVNSAAWPAMKGDAQIVGVFVYTRGGESADAAFHARMFAPEAGVTEDPATGSAVATLPGQILAGEAVGEGRHDWLIEQGFAMGRPSRIHLSADVAGGKVAEVRIAGHAVPLCEGTIDV